MTSLLGALLIFATHKAPSFVSMLQDSISLGGMCLVWFQFYARYFLDIVE